MVGFVYNPVFYCRGGLKFRVFDDEHGSVSFNVKFRKTEIDQVYIVLPEIREDPRGCFMRVWSEAEALAHRLEAGVKQMNLSSCLKQGTVRGLHYQVGEAAEAKVIRCIRGRIFEVVVDTRAESSTFGQWFGIELTAANRAMIYVPKGCANGYQALENESEILYHSSAEYSASSERGVRYNDPRVGIQWPQPVTVVSEKDRSWPDLTGHV